MKTGTKPVTFFFLFLPYGICGGFIIITLPFVLVQNGFSVAQAAAITALGISANICTIIWAPVIDLTFSLRKWYLLIISLCSLSIICLVFIPFNESWVVVLTIIVFAGQLFTALLSPPIGGMIAKTISAEAKGRASGWLQAANLGGQGLGGGAGVWLYSHTSFQVACVIIALISFLCCAALYFVPRVPADRSKSLKEGFKTIYIDLKSLLNKPMVVFSLALITTPIGVGAFSFVWSSMAIDWQIKADGVALFNGTLTGVVSAVGCIAGGWITDKYGRWIAFFGAGMILAMISLTLSFLPLIPVVFKTGVLLYSFFQGLNYAAYTAIILRAIGKGVASTKYALLSSFGNLPLSLMAFTLGRIHDSYSVRVMLMSEAFIGIGFIIIASLILYTFRHKILIQTS